MTTTMHTPTPISTRMATIATRLGWKDTSYYGDTDFGLSQTFTSGAHHVLVDYGPDGRHGVGDHINSVGVTDGTGANKVFYLQDENQTRMRNAVTTVLAEYLQE